MGNKLHTVVVQTNGTTVNTYTSWHENIVVKNLTMLSEYEIKELLHYGSVKQHIGDTKHTYYYCCWNTI